MNNNCAICYDEYEMVNDNPLCTTCDDIATMKERQVYKAQREHAVRRRVSLAPDDKDQLILHIIRLLDNARSMMWQGDVKQVNKVADELEIALGMLRKLEGMQ